MLNKKVAKKPPRQTAIVSDRRRITIRQVGFVIEDVEAADPSLWKTIEALDKKQIKLEIDSALATMKTLELLQKKTAITGRNKIIRRIDRATTQLLKLLSDLMYDAEHEKTEDKISGWVQGQLAGPMVEASLKAGSTSPSLQDLVRGLKLLAIGAKKRATPFQARGSVNQVFVAESLTRIFETHFEKKATRSRREDNLDGAFIAFAQSVMNMIRVPITAETVSTMMSNRQRRQSVGQ
jgi:hypothetical protein